MYLQISHAFEVKPYDCQIHIALLNGKFTSHRSVHLQSHKAAVSLPVYVLLVVSFLDHAFDDADYHLSFFPYRLQSLFYIFYQVVHLVLQFLVV